MLTVLALHYWAGSGREYEAVRALLPATVRLLAPDLPGFGKQPVPPGFDFSVAHYADWLAGFIADNKMAEFTLLGHSMGGKIALALAARRPAGLRQLVLLAPSPPTPEPITDAARSAALAAFGQAAEAEKTFRNITEKPLAEALHRLVVADNLCCTRPAWEAWLERGSREDISALMATLAVPCSVLVGANDRAITSETQQQQTLPWLPATTRLRVEPATGHLLPLEVPALVAALALQSFK
ncbi:alpha/beta hydrolase [Hymenobacter sp. BT683]|uniref:Alpha/beta hydrolase n=1 Tax=Hymenobacter jeongseonensis TaxID=2791027 RepID=A0ABS0IN77_9BACT|nr:alpha/beta hydrolase [Hymenobacter jeongseonensis]MBF9239240.1 alpha/beta hydrolase [Hymenobacter jeongseonensis]